LRYKLLVYNSKINLPGHAWAKAPGPRKSLAVNNVQIPNSNQSPKINAESTLKSRIIYIPKNNQNLILANSFSPFQKGEIE
jgi:hypothetical protein